MGKGKKKNARKDFLEELGAETEAADAANAASAPAGEEPKLSRKEKRNLKLQKRGKGPDADNDENGAEDEQEEEAQEESGHGRAAGFAALNGDEDEDEDDEDDDSAEVAPQKAAAGFAALDSDADEPPSPPVASGFAALNLSDDESDADSGAKKDKKAKKEKKPKKEKRAKRDKRGDEQDGAGSDDAGEEDTATTSSSRRQKLSNKERRRLKDAEEAEQRERQVAELGTATATSFAVSATSIKKDDAWLNARDVVVPSFTVSAYGKTLFQNAELRIAEGRKYGFVGPNGHGKSTLLRLIAGGELEIPPTIDTIYVDQEVPADDTPAVDMVLRADTRREQLLAREAELLAVLEREETDDLPEEAQAALQEEMTAVGEELRARNAHAAEAKALSLLTGLGFTKDMLRAPTRSFSGGWRMRVSIARALFLERTLTLLDEPSNHLDLNSAIYLTEVLRRWKKTLVLVSHDSSLLESVSTDIMCLANRRLLYYSGGFDKYEGQRRQDLEKEKKQWERQEKEMKALKKRGATNQKAQEQLAAKQRREGGKGRRGKNANDDDDDAGGAAAGSLADKQLMSRPRDYVVNFEFPDPAGDILGNYISVEDVAFKYEGGKTLFKKLSFGIDKDSRITIVGPNGVGKSTLLKVMMQELEPTKGQVTLRRGLRVAKYHQHFLDVLPADMSPVDFLRQEHNIDHQTARNLLGRFGLEGSAHTIKLLNCSGGQKSRVVFANMALQEPEILCLDEPTNNLDLESVQALIDAINAFGGAVVLISHDERLIVETECRLWVLDDRTVTEWEGGFEAYRDSILAGLAAQEAENARRLEEKKLLADAERERKMAAIAQRRQAKKGGASSAALPASS